MRQIQLLLIAVVSILFACGPGDHSQTAVTLDNGLKWTANPETTTGIQNMLKLTDAFSATADADAYSKLKTGLENEFQLIFKNCTMKGEAHNQLHNYLLPMKDMFGGLASSKQESRQESFRKLQAHLSAYADYFES